MSITPNNVIADSHDVNKNTEEPLPLNDPFVGNSSLGSGGSILSSGQAGERKEMSLYNFKLVGIISGSEESYVSLVNASGEIITLKLQDELSDGVKLVDMTLNEAVFQKADDTYITINFKNNIKETDVF
ncbi:MAG: hypothetical protein QNK48_03375 [Pelagibacteraceae bacterium]|nr:hypothetical protein [Pelagibacteraceae bacterium]MDB0036838.1 hypothetical protein [Pelagibacteraceae bacterium]MDB4022493.1 hypothetical protein [Pelagibacteraceae bacterium]